MWFDVGMFLVVTFLGAGVLAAAQPALGIDLVVVEIVQFAPALGAGAVVLARLHRPRGERLVHVSLGISRAVWPKLGFSVLVGGTVAAVLIGYGAYNAGQVAMNPFGDLPAPFLLIVLAQFIGACGEEVGWRCYLQPRLQQRFGMLPSAVAVGVLWACWHVQIFAMPPLYIAAFIVACVAMSVILAVLLAGDPKGNLLVSGFFHTVVNLAMLMFITDEEGTAEQLALTLPCVLFAVVAVAFGRRRIRKST